MKIFGSAIIAWPAALVLLSGCATYENVDPPADPFEHAAAPAFSGLTLAVIADDADIVSTERMARQVSTPLSKRFPQADALGALVSALRANFKSVERVEGAGQAYRRGFDLVATLKAEFEDHGMSDKYDSFRLSIAFSDPRGGPVQTINVEGKSMPRQDFGWAPSPLTLPYPRSFPKSRDRAAQFLTIALRKSTSLAEYAATRGGSSFAVPALVAAPSSGGSLNAADIERIAKAVQRAAPAAQAAGAPLPASPLPRFTAAERPDDLAVVIGVETYSDIATKAAYAERDADAFKAHVRALGVPERNIVLLKGAKAGKASFEKNIEQWLPRMAKPGSRVYFYFSGHGAPDLKTNQAYLVPWDGDPNFLETTAYPLAKLYKKLGELPAKQVLVAMDSCFSGAGGRSVLAAGVRPLVSRIETGAVPASLTVLAASASNEVSGSLDDKGHGAFTYFLLQGLDAGETTPKALIEYLTPRVQDEARRLNRDQTPQLQGDGSWSLR